MLEFQVFMQTIKSDLQDVTTREDSIAVPETTN